MGQDRPAAASRIRRRLVAAAQVNKNGPRRGPNQTTRDHRRAKIPRQPPVDAPKIPIQPAQGGSSTSPRTHPPRRKRNGLTHKPPAPNPCLPTPRHCQPLVGLISLARLARLAWLAGPESFSHRPGRGSSSARRTTQPAPHHTTPHRTTPPSSAAGPRHTYIMSERLSRLLC